jgi:hypothetical protein
LNAEAVLEKRLDCKSEFGKAGEPGRLTRMVCQGAAREIRRQFIFISEGMISGSGSGDQIVTMMHLPNRSA